MCNPSSVENKVGAVKYIRNNGIGNRILIPDFMERFQHAFQPSRCPVDGVFLTKSQMRPSGRATRCMCYKDYKRLIVDQPKRHCFICSDPLPDSKIEEQLQNTREIRAHMHEGECWSWWTIVHNVVLGDRELPKLLGTQLAAVRVRWKTCQAYCVSYYHIEHNLYRTVCLGKFCVRTFRTRPKVY
jgi:hypothetical protein